MKMEESFKCFEYIIDKRKRSRICFGSTLPREVLPKSGPSASSFMKREGASLGNELGFYEGAAGKPTSVARMYTIGRAPRWLPDKSYHPPPRPPVAPKETKHSSAPFNHSAKRKMTVVSNNNPGPGTYSLSDEKRQMKFYHSFGGKKTVIPAVNVKCVPFNEDTCSNCGVRCTEQGDYWHKNDKTFLCRTCMDNAYSHSRRRKRDELNEYSAIRDCFFAHYHELFSNSVKLMNANQIRKKIYKESYLSGYFPLIEGGAKKREKN